MAGISPTSTRPSCSSVAHTAGTSKRTSKRSGRASRPRTSGLVFRYDTAPRRAGLMPAPVQTGVNPGGLDVAPHFLDASSGASRAPDRQSGATRSRWLAPKVSATCASLGRTAASRPDGRPRARRGAPAPPAARRVAGGRCRPPTAPAPEGETAGDAGVGLEHARARSRPWPRARRRGALHRQVPRPSPAECTAADLVRRHQIHGRFGDRVQPRPEGPEGLGSGPHWRATRSASENPVRRTPAPRDAPCAAGTRRSPPACRPGPATRTSPHDAASVFKRSSTGAWARPGPARGQR
jgi:hypothetical protein